MPSRLRPSLPDQRGFTLVELLLGMSMALVVAGAGFTLISAAETKNRSNALRANSLNGAQVKLERMMREFRQAEWVVFRNSSIVDLHVPVHSTTGTSVARHVRYNCSSQVRCAREEGPATAYPPPTDPVVQSRDTEFISSLSPGPVFRPQRMDPTTGEPVADFIAPTAVEVTLRIAVEDWEDPMRIEDGVSLRNATTFGS